MRLRPRVSQTLRDLVDVVEATRRPMMNTVGPDAGEAASARERLEDHSGGEVMRAILRGLTPKDLVRAGGVNRKWRKLCEDESLWRSACESNPVLVALRARPTNLARRWKALFLQRAQARCVEKRRGQSKLPRIVRGATSLSASWSASASAPLGLCRTHQTCQRMVAQAA